MTPALLDLAGRIVAEHHACAVALRAGLAHAMAAGRLLLEARAAVGHGGWSAWLAAHCPFSERTAQGYMRVARHAGELAGGDPQRVADLSLRGALAMLAGPKLVENFPQVAEPEPPAPGRPRAMLAEAEATIEAAGRNIVAMGRAALEVRAAFAPHPGRFDAWLAAEFDAEARPMVLMAMRLVEGGVTAAGPVLAGLADLIAPPDAA
jgi:hypothetical protein